MNSIKCLLMFSVLFGYSATGESRHNRSPASDPTPFFKPYAHPYLSRLALSLGTGITEYSGELSRPLNARLQYYYFNPYLHAGAEYLLTHYLSLQIAGGYTRLRSRTNAGNWNDMKFSTPMGELYATLVAQLIPKGHIEKHHLKFTPYLMAGVGGIYYQTRTSGTVPVWENVYNRPPSRLAAIVPLGLGMAYYHTEQLSIRLEASYRITTTDMLDGGK